ncbi:hypothetical protein GCM10027168_01780 [Streptomyces capparidis]
MERMVTADAAPALGDMRRMGRGDTVWLTPGAERRADWSRCVDAATAALMRGADVRWCRRG